jgi:hypothetical protein
MTVAQRNNATIKTVTRRPPGILSIIGPMNGATIAKGAKLIAKNSSTRLRAASGLIDKNSESANAMAKADSPNAISECTRPRRLSGDAGARPDFERAIRLFSRIYSQARGW